MDKNPYALDAQPAVDKNPYAIGDQTISNTPTTAESRVGSMDDAGLCQKFAEEVTLGHGGVYPSAVDAWNDQSQKGNASTDFTQLQPGDLIYFAPDASNGNYGHVGVYNGNQEMISATYNGVQKSNLTDWMNSTGQRPMGFVRGYK